MKIFIAIILVWWTNLLCLWFFAIFSLYLWILFNIIFM